jgi:hypothetical protein
LFDGKTTDFPFEFKTCETETRVDEREVGEPFSVCVTDENAC